MIYYYEAVVDLGRGSYCSVFANSKKNALDWINYHDYNNGDYDYDIYRLTEYDFYSRMKNEFMYDSIKIEALMFHINTHGTTEGWDWI